MRLNNWEQRQLDCESGKRLDEVAARKERLVAALRSSSCPCPVREDHTVSACVDSGNCGCDNAAALSAPAADGEAVAWLCNGKGDGWEEKNRVVFTKQNAEYYRRPGWTVQPLYPAPCSDAVLREALVNAEHCLGAVINHLERLYEEHPNDPRLREHLSDEVPWLEELKKALSSSGYKEKCLNCNDANAYGDYEGPTCEVCGGTGRIPAPSALSASGSPGDVGRETITVPFNPCLAKLREGEPFFVLLGRDKQAPNAVMTWANDREAAEGKSPWTEQAREVAHQMAAYSGIGKAPSDPAAPQGQDAAASNDPLAPLKYEILRLTKEGKGAFVDKIIRAVCVHFDRTRAPEATEAVAYLYHKPGGTPLVSIGKIEWPYTVEPLYTAPPAAKPVSVETIARVIREHVEYGYARADSRKESIVGVETAATAIHALFNGGGDGL